MTKASNVKTDLRGAALLQEPLLNKGTAFTAEERKALGLEGLLPPHVFSLQQQVDRVMSNYRRKTTDLERYIHLMSLQDRNETLFYKVVCDYLEEMMPIIYTPTVGQACQEFSHIFRRARGLYLSIENKGRLLELMSNWKQDVRVIVVTDGERILGLGDQGTSGMGIPIGKLSLYTACAGINPSHTLPITLDVGTENEGFLKDPAYIGMRSHRVRGAEYDAFVDEFVEAAQKLWPKALIQFEDFGNTTAFHILERWRDRVCTFNDDIQGTASVALAGIFSALRVTKTKLCDQRILFLGAGEAGTGIADLICSAMVDEGSKIEDARRRCWFVDTKGLVVKSRTGLAAHKLRYAHDAKPADDFLAAVRAIEPTAIIGVSTSAKAFNQEIVETMAKMNQRPIIFALSNPTSKSECSAEEAYRWTKGKAIYASGSPFPPVSYEGKTFVPGQGNNAYIFPGVGLGAVATASSRITDRMFSTAARTLASLVEQSDLDMGRMYPSLTRIREISLAIGTAVAETVYQDGLAQIQRPADLKAAVKAAMWEPEYDNYVG